MAVWLTTEHSLCYHDPTPAQTEQLIERAPYSTRRIGLSGPEVCLTAAGFTGCPCVIIHRSKAEAFPSFWEIVRRVPEVEMTEAQLSRWWDDREALLGGLTGKHVSFELLNNEATMRNLWEYLLPGVPFDAERYRLLNDLNITQDTFGRKEREWPLQQ